MNTSSSKGEGSKQGTAGRKHGKRQGVVRRVCQKWGATAPGQGGRECGQKKHQFGVMHARARQRVGPAQQREAAQGSAFITSPPGVPR